MDWKDNKTFRVIPPTNETALKRLNSVGLPHHVLPDRSLDEAYYNEDSSEASKPSGEVEEIQPNDKKPQKDNLEENYKSKVNLLHAKYDDNTVVDHPMLKNTHGMGIVGAALVITCVCIYVAIVIWRRNILNRKDDRQRLINEDDFYSSKSIHPNVKKNHKATTLI